MKARDVGHRIQNAFDWAKSALEPVETRWLVFGITTVVLFLLRGVGAQGLSTLLALIYIMYFVTLGQTPRQDR